MSSIFCCGNTTSYKNRSLSHEPKFNSFMAWGKVPKTTSPSTDVDISPTDVTFAVQVVRQVNFGPLESKRYFVQPNGGGDEFVEVTEQWLLDANFQKLNT